MQSVRSNMASMSTRLTAVGVLMLVGTLLAVWLSRAFPYGTHPHEGPLVPFICVTVALGIALVIAMRWISDDPTPKRLLMIIVLIGLAMRGAMFLSYPVLEDDSYRYLWDGAVVSEGVNPYKYAPADGYYDPNIDLPGNASIAEDLKAFRQLAEENATAHTRVAYPFIRTIYPPIAQLAFGAAHQINPFGLTGWRIILLFSDVIGMIILLKTLQLFGRSSAWSILYWWNPVVIVQGFGAGHMDILVVPFLLGALLLHRSNRTRASVVALAGAAAVKLWPILLFPILTRKWLSSPLKLVGVTMLFLAITLLLLMPQILSALSQDSGVYAYSTSWRRHAFLFTVLQDGVFGWSEFGGDLARILVLILVSAVTLVAAFKLGDNQQTVPAAIIISVAALLFLSPTGYPWYLIWLVPFLPFVPSFGLTVLTATAPLYYLRFLFGDDNPIYVWGLVPVAFGIPILLLIMSFRAQRT